MKTKEQLAAEKYPFELNQMVEMTDHDYNIARRMAFVDGYTARQALEKARGGK